MLMIDGSSVVDCAFCINKFIRKHGVGFSWNDLGQKPFPLVGTNLFRLLKLYAFFACSI